MRSGAVDTDRFKVEGRQTGHRRKMSKNTSVLNGASASFNYAAENDSVVRKVKLTSSFQDHTCTKSHDLSHKKMDGIKEEKKSLPCGDDHLHTDDNTVQKKSNGTSAEPSHMIDQELTLTNINLRNMLISHIDIINQLQEELARKNRLISAQSRETAKLRACLDRKKRKMCLVRRNCAKSDDDSTDNALDSRSNFSNSEVPSVTASSSTTAFISSGPSVRTPVLATRYFGRRSKTVPSRALKRRYMGPPKTFPVKKLAIKSESSTASVSSTSEMNDIDCQQTLVPLEILEDGIITTGIRRVRKRRGRRPKRVPKNTDYLTTDKAYFLADLRPAPETLSSSEIHVPSWKLKPVTSFYQMEGTENINDPVFERRHQKFELDERRRKRWDIQRIRDQKALEKRRAREKEKSAKRKSLSLLPDLRHIEYIEVTEQLPVTAFGHLIPLFQPCEFCLPWNLKNNVVEDVSECSPAPPAPPTPSPSKGRRGRPSISGPKVT